MRFRKAAVRFISVSGWALPLFFFRLLMAFTSFHGFVIQYLLNIVKCLIYIFQIFFIFLLPLLRICCIMINVRRWLDMSIEQKLKMALAYSGTSQAELARRIGTTPSNLNQKVKRNTLTNEELDQIARALGGTWRAEFVFSDGTVI